tara:strand:- start:2374 stop:2613 length:240 start_codon:yes stop_codon:yes gene_type:complete
VNDFWAFLADEFGTAVISLEVYLAQGYRVGFIPSRTPDFGNRVIVESIHYEWLDLDDGIDSYEDRLFNGLAGALDMRSR